MIEVTHGLVNASHMALNERSGLHDTHSEKGDRHRPRRLKSAPKVYATCPPEPIWQTTHIADVPAGASCLSHSNGLAPAPKGAF